MSAPGISGERQAATLLMGAALGFICALCMALIAAGILGPGGHNLAIFGATWISVIFFAARKAEVLP